MTLSNEERETIVTVTAAETEVRIYSAIPRHISRMRSNSSFTERKKWTEDGTEVVEFTIASKDWNPASGAKRKRVLTPEQREATAVRLEEARKKARNKSE